MKRRNHRTLLIHIAATVIFLQVSNIRPAFAGSTVTRSYAIIVGNNAPPADAGGRLATLRYADDDVIRVYQFLNQFVQSADLLTIPDKITQQRYPQIANVARIPSLKNIDASVRSIKKRIIHDKAMGNKSVVYLYFSGHGSHNDQGIAGLVLADGSLTRNRLYRHIIDELPAEYIHLFMDACYAEGIVGSRGFFDHEESATTVTLSSEERDAATAPAPSQYPGLGIFISSTDSQESHEWSKLESGVFTHVVLSGLSGLADINGDGDIAYSELYAFTSAANRNVKKALARINVVVTPPERNENEPIVNAGAIQNAAYLYGKLSSIGKFHISTEHGVRILDGNLSGDDIVHFRVPTNQQLYVQNQNSEAIVRLARNETQDIQSLSFKRKKFTAKGAVESALEKGLFETPYCVEYYQGIIDSAEMISVNFNVSTLSSPMQTGPADMSPPVSPQHVATQKRWSKTLLAAATLSAGVTATFAVLSIRSNHKWRDLDTSELTGDEYDIEYEKYNNRYEHYRNAAWISALAIPFLTLTGILLWPRNTPDKKPFYFAPGPGQNAHVQLNFFTTF